jgi:hypothetical protein
MLTEQLSQSKQPFLHVLEQLRHVGAAATAHHERSPPGIPDGLQLFMQN